MSIALTSIPIPVDFLYQTLDQNEQLVGTANTPADIPPGATQLFFINITTKVEVTLQLTLTFTFQGTNTAPAPTIDDVNTMVLYAPSTPPPDFIPIAATCKSDDGVTQTVNVPGPGGSSTFSAAVINVGTSGSGFVSAQHENHLHPLCRTNPQTGECLAPPSPEVSVSLNTGEIATFTIFIQESAVIPYDPTTNRIFVVFRTAPVPNPGLTLALTSVAVRTHSPECAPDNPSLEAVVTPIVRSVQVGTPATAFAAVTNIGAETATDVSITLQTVVSVDFLYQTLDQNEQLIGTANTPADIPPGTTQLFLISITPKVEITLPPTFILSFQGTNTSPAPTIEGVNQIILRASNTLPPDFIPIAATCKSDDGAPLTVNVPGPGGSLTFSAAVINAGTTGSGFVSAQHENHLHPLCRTNPQTGDCLTPPSSEVQVTLNTGEIATFTIFVQENEVIPYDPTTNRIFVVFRTAPIPNPGLTLALTSVAVRTHSPACVP